MGGFEEESDNFDSLEGGRNGFHQRGRKAFSLLLLGGFLEKRETEERKA